MSTFKKVSEEVIRERTYHKYQSKSFPMIKMELITVNGKFIQAEFSDLLFSDWYSAPINEQLEVGQWKNLCTPPGSTQQTYRLSEKYADDIKTLFTELGLKLEESK
jgi:hypothetical protein